LKGEDGMNVKHVGLCGLVLFLLSTGAARAQSTAAPDNAKPPSVMDPPPPPASTDTPQSTPATPMGSLSNWITYCRPGCCGPIGGNGPILPELYVRTGPSLPVAGPFFGHTLETGWVAQGGSRVLFFNETRDAAWTVDLSISNVVNHGQHSDRVALLRDIIVQTPSPFGGTTATRLPAILVTVQSLNRTFGNLGAGREWYLSRPDENSQRSWRIGVDGGGRFGTAKLDLNELQHRTDTLGGIFVSLHSDLEVPAGACLWQFGFRVEWDYTWSDILQIQNNADIQDLNLLFTAGVQF
jgi:hypothetical protein